MIAEQIFVFVMKVQLTGGAKVSGQNVSSFFDRLSESTETLEQWIRIRILCSFRIYAQNFCRTHSFGVMSESLGGLKIKFGQV